MNKEQIKMLTKAKLTKLSKKWLWLIASKEKQFGNVSVRARQVLAEQYGINSKQA